MKFQDLGLIKPILSALEAEGYTEPTPIQKKAIPPALAGRDVLGCAQTGTGKTCAFAAPILQRLNGKNGNPRVIKALILTPTRELAIQIGDSFKSYGRNLSLRSTVIFGGVGQQPQADAIKRGLDILIATPGRLLDLQGQGLLDLSHIEIFVLDEADRMLDMGFIHDVRRVLKLLPQKKQTLFFSATMPPEVMDLVNGLLHDYARVAVDPVSSPVEVIRQSLYYVDKNNKTKLLAHLLETQDIKQALVFSRTKHGANRIARDLEKAGVSAAAIHGNKSQTARVQALGDFKAGKLRVLVATDIAARGIDIEDLGCVFNYNLPDVPETYVHRIGRTGRAGKDGVAISFCQFDEKDELKAIEKLLGKPIPVVEGHPFPMVNLEVVKDKHGKVVNAEDQEAKRAAASAEAARRSRGDSSRVPGGDQSPPDAPPALRGGAGKERSAKKKKDTVEKPMGQPGQKAKKEPKKKPEIVESATAEDLLNVRVRPLTAGTRRGRLEDTLPAEPAMPAADFVKPNPMDSDVIMDATARLLAPRRPARTPPPAPVKPAPEPRKESREEKREEKREQERQKKRDKKQAPEAQKTRQEPRREPLKAERARPEPMSAPDPAPAGHKKRRHRGGRHGANRPVSSARQKDNTEQKSIIKPYYISHDD